MAENEEKKERPMLMSEWMEFCERTGYKSRLRQIFDSPVKPDGNCNIPINKEQKP